MSVQNLLVDYISKLPVWFAKVAVSGFGEVFGQIFDATTERGELRVCTVFSHLAD